MSRRASFPAQVRVWTYFRMVEWKNSKLYISGKPKKYDGGHVLSARRGVLLSAGVKCLLIEDVARCLSALVIWLFSRRSFVASRDDCPRLLGCWRG